MYTVDGLDEQGGSVQKAQEVGTSVMAGNGTLVVRGEDGRPRGELIRTGADAMVMEMSMQGRRGNKGGVERGLRNV